MKFCKTSLGNNDRRFEPSLDRLKNSIDADLEADPFRAGASMAIDAAIDVEPLDTDIVRVQGTVPPPLGRTEQPDDRSSSSDRQVGRTRVSSDVNTRRSREFVKTFQARFSTMCVRTAGLDDRFRQTRLVRTSHHDRSDAEFFPEAVC